MSAALNHRTDVPGADDVHAFPSGDGALSYLDTGSGRPLVLLHGGFLDRTMWDAQIPALSAEFRIIAPDARGHGASANATRPFRLTDDLAGLLRHAGVSAGNPAILVGLSMGGATAVDTALEHPELVRAVVVSGVGTSEPEFTDPFLLEGFAEQQAAMERGDFEGLVASVAAHQIGPGRTRADLDPAVDAQVDAMIRRTLLKHVDDREDHRTPVTRTWERLPEITVPVHAINGGADSADHLAMPRRLVDAVPHGTLTTVPDVGHLPNMERPKEFNALLRAFLDGLDG